MSAIFFTKQVFNCIKRVIVFHCGRQVFPVPLYMSGLQGYNLG